MKLCKDRLFNCMELMEFVDEKHALAFDLWSSPIPIREGKAPCAAARLDAQRYAVLFWRQFQNHVHAHAHFQSSGIRGPLGLHSFYAWLMGATICMPSNAALVAMDSFDSLLVNMGMTQSEPLVSH